MGSAIWVVTDGHAGNERQALALARALARAMAGTDASASMPAPEPRVWTLQARTPWKQAAPHRLPGSDHAFGEEFRMALREPPRLAIGCGRQGALATRLLREAGTRVVQILDPRLDPGHWDVVVVPEHDRLRGPNVVTMLGSLHEVDATWLAQARLRHPRCGNLPAPRSLLLLGGPVRNVPLDESWWRRTVESLRAINLRDGGSLSVCASRRTPPWLADAARRDLSAFGSAAANASPARHWLGPEDGANPYPGLLAWSERIVVSPDSVNMLSEAAATGARVRIAEPGIASGRHASFLDALIRRGAASPLDADAAPARSTVLRELPRVAAIVRERLGS